MEAKIKAKELVDKMYYSGRYDDKEDYIPAMAWERAKQCAIITADEILNSFGLTINGQTFFAEYRAIDFYEEVKQEIEKL
jgi:hypothetical protein